MTDRERIIKGLECCLGANDCDIEPEGDCPYKGMCLCAMALRLDILAFLKEQEEQIKSRDESLEKAREEIKWLREMLKEQEVREPHYTILRYSVDGKEVTVQHPECPKYIENGLLLWDAEIEKGQAYCKRCGQAVKWNE